MKKMGMLFGVMLMLSVTACAGNGAAKETAKTGAETTTVTETTTAQGTESQKADSAAAGEKQKILIGFATNTIDQNVQRNLNGLLKAADEVNASRDDVEVEIIYTDGQASVEKQLADVESLIVQAPDAVILAGVDTSGSIPAAEALHNAGIYCMEIRGMESDAIDLKFAGSDEYAITEMVADWYKEQLDQDPDLKLNAVLIYGYAGQSAQLVRHDGFKKLVEEYPGRVNILDENYADWKTDNAQKLMEDWLQLYGDELNCVVSASDDMSLGAVNAMKAAGWTCDDVIISSIDGTSIGMDLIAEGWVDVDTKMLMSRRGSIQVDLIVKALSGEFTDNYYNAGAECTVCVTADNLDEYRDLD